MHHKTTVTILLLLLISVAFSQDYALKHTANAVNLTNNANAIIQFNKVEINLNSTTELHVLKKRVITVLNKEGDNAIDAYVYYDSDVKIKHLEAIVYNASGNQIKKIRKNDFKDVSAVDGGTLYSEYRMKYLEYTPINYPYTVEFSVETLSNTTAFIPSFNPLDNYFISVEKSTYSVRFANHLKIKTKEKNFENFDLIKEELSGEIKYSAENIEAIKPEKYAPSFFDITPKALVALSEFTLKGIHTQVETWDDFGMWMYHDLIKDTHDLPTSTISMIQDLVKDEPNKMDKAKKIYQYVQDKMRYISVQVGIGGWKPFNASEVDKLGYGDCKGLTNYTMSLLEAVGIISHYTVVFAGQSKRNLEKDFVAMQGNHVILNVPMEEEDVWLECTSQKLPFGFIGDFTDDRDVLVITSKGATIQHTEKYEVEGNLQTIAGNYNILQDGSIKAAILVTSKGIQYDNKYWLESETERDLDIYYKKRWRYINDLTLNTIHLDNNRDTIELVEQVSFSAPGYAKVLGDRMLITINALNRNTQVPDRYRNRQSPLSISRGFKNVDEIEIKLPIGYQVEVLPIDKSIINKFGTYKTEIITKDENTLIYKRIFSINDGEFPKEDYSKFRTFYKEVTKQDNSKIALIKSQL